MSIEGPGEAEARPATPTWPGGGPGPGSPATPVRVSGAFPPPTQTAGTPDDPPTAPDEELEEEFEQFDWDSWEPTAPEDVAPEGEVDWAALTATEPPAEPEPAPAVPASPLAQPLPASGRPWPAASPVITDIVHVRVPRWAPFATGIALALAMVLSSAALVSQTGRLGLTLSVLSGQVPTSADAVVRAYLSAVASGDATKAMTYLYAPPADSMLLTDSVLAQSNAQAPLTIVTIGHAASSLDGTEQVPATYRIGSLEVSTAFNTGFSDGQWTIRDDPGRLGVGSIRAAGIPLSVNGVEIPETVDSLPAFPGTYTLSTTSPYITYAAPGTVVVRSPDEATVIGAVRLQLTTAGRDAALATARAAVTSCLQQQSLHPDGCPQNIAANANEPVVPGSVTYSVMSELPMTVTTTDLRAATATASYAGTWHLVAQVLVNGTPRAITYDFAVSTLWQVTLSGARPAATLVAVS